MKKLLKIFLICYFVFADFAFLLKDMSLIPKQISIDVSTVLLLLKVFDLLAYILMGATVLLVVSALGCWIRKGFKVSISLNKEMVFNRFKAFFNFKTRPIKAFLWIVQILIGIYVIPFAIMVVCDNVRTLLG